MKKMMPSEEKQLLLKDLCGRLPYGVKVHITDEWFYDKIEPYDRRLDCDVIKHIRENQYTVKPYLRPMSSMTEEEMKELRHEHVKDMKMFADCLTKSAEGDNSERGKVISHYAADWCNKNHFDYRGLIPIGLALEAPEDMYSHAD